MYPLLGKKNAKFSRPPQASRDMFTTVARISELSYCRTKITKMTSVAGTQDVIEPIGLPSCIDFDSTDGSVIIKVQEYSSSFKSSYYILDSYANNSIWVLAPKSAAFIDAKCIIVFRGTHVLQDIVTDFKLAAAVAGDFDHDLLEICDSLFQILTESIFLRHGITAEDNVILVGHSLGASLAEMMLLRLRAEFFKSVTAYCFDTPGLPDTFRSKFDPLQNLVNPELTLIYAFDNIFNNLTSAPSNAVCYRVGNDPEIIKEVWRYIWTVPSLLSGVHTLFVESLRSHSIDNIATHLSEGRFHHDAITSGRCISGSILRFAFRLMRPFAKQNHQSRTLHPDHDIPPRHISQQEAPYFRPFPGVARARGVFLENRTKVITQYEYSDFGHFIPEQYYYAPPKDPVPYSIPSIIKFSQQLNPYNDVVIPFVGMTSVGKTSLIKALFDVRGDSELQVSATMDTTEVNRVLLWDILNEGVLEKLPVCSSDSNPTETSPLLDGAQPSNMSSQRSGELRIWLMDVRGVHDSEMSFRKDELSESVRSQLRSLNTVVQAAVFVSDTPTSNSRRLFQEVCDVVDSRVIVVRNYKEEIRTKGEKDKVLKEAEDTYLDVLHTTQRKKCVEETGLSVILTKVCRFEGAVEKDFKMEENIGVLKNKLKEALGAWRDEITEKVEEARAKENLLRDGVDATDMAAVITGATLLATGGYAVGVTVGEGWITGSLVAAGIVGGPAIMIAACTTGIVGTACFAAVNMYRRFR